MIVKGKCAPCGEVVSFSVHDALVKCPRCGLWNNPDLARQRYNEAERRQLQADLQQAIAEPKLCGAGAVSCVGAASEQPTKASGGSNDTYYTVEIKKPTKEGKAPYVAECNDIIEALGMNYAEGNAFKAIWRSCAEKHLGLLKPGQEPGGVYDAEKVVFFGQRMLELRK